MGLSYEKSKKVALRIILLLAVITVVEVIIALLGKGYLIEGVKLPHWLMGILMIGLSVAKATYIIFEFMHMKYEVKGLSRSVLLPTLLLVWGIIAFLWEGDTWKERRAKYIAKTEQTMAVDVMVDEHGHDVSKGHHDHDHHGDENHSDHDHDEHDHDDH